MSGRCDPRRNPFPNIMAPPTIKGPVSDPLPCIKQTFASEAEAEKHAAPLGQYAYRCPSCMQWHATRSRRRSQFRRRQ